MIGILIYKVLVTYIDFELLQVFRSIHFNILPQRYKDVIFDGHIFHILGIHPCYLYIYKGLSYVMQNWLKIKQGDN